MSEIKWAYENFSMRLDRANKRLFALIIILVGLFLASNIGWLLYVSQFKVEETVQIDAEQQADGNSNNYIIGGNYGGQTESDSNENQKVCP